MKNRIILSTVLVFLNVNIVLSQEPISLGNLKINGETNNGIESLENINGKLFFSIYDSPLNQIKKPYVSDGTTAGTVRLTNYNTGSKPEFVKIGNMAFFADTEGLKKTDGTVAGTSLISAGVGGRCAAVNNTYFFVNYQDQKLWKSDGTAAGTVVVKNVDSPTFIRNLIGAGNLLFFIATDALNGEELWRSDGTEAGTYMIKDIFPGAVGSSAISDLTTMNNILYFTASSNIISSSTIWRSDGTFSGTYQLTVADGSYSPYQPNNLTVVNNTLYFISYQSLWKADGTANGLEPFGNFYGPNGNSLINQVVSRIYNSNSTLYLSTYNYDDPKSGNLFKSDGTLTGTLFLKKLKLATVIYPYFLRLDQTITLNGIFYFSASDTHHGFELWKTDGTTTGTVLVKDINTGVLDSNPLKMNVLNNEIYFFANNINTGHELWKSNGTEAGTTLVKDIQANDFDSNPYQFLHIGTKLYFGASNIANPTSELMVLNDNFSLALPQQSTFGSIVSPNNLTNFNNQLYFSGNQYSGRELWKSDGTYLNTVLVKDINAGSNSNPNYLTVSNNTLFFSAKTALNGVELWKSDGTEAGTVLVKDIYPSTVAVGPGGTITTVQDASPFKLVDHNGLLYFAATSANGTELWRSDGTVANTVQVNDINPSGNGLSSATEIVSTPNTLFFKAFNVSTGTELWKIDVANPNGMMIKDISLGTSSSDPANITPFGNSIYFSASTLGFDGNELWKSDGTAVGTLIVRNIAGNLSSNPLNLKMLNGILYFSADDHINGRELWRSDGTFSGTYMLKNINPTSFSDPSSLTLVGNALYFTANDGKHGRELWKTDGTANGTVLAYNLFDEIRTTIPFEINSSFPDNLYSHNNILYFGANSGKLGIEPFKFKPCELLTTNIYKDNYLPSQSMHTTHTIIANNKFFNTSTVNYFAGNSILLTPGFKVSAGAGESNTFRAEIRGCY